MHKTLFAIPCLAAALALPFSARAGNFIGHSQPGKPGYAVQFWPSFSHDRDGVDTARSFFQLAWFSETGVTGTTRDQFELWGAINAGYQTTPKGSDESRWGLSVPQLGAEYYYQMYSSQAAPGETGFRSWWISPTLIVNGPNGSSKSAGMGAGADQYSVSLNVNNYVGYNRWEFTVSPVSAFYAFRNRSKTALAEGEDRALRGGLSMTFADVAVGYRAGNGFSVGTHHQYDVYNMSDSDFDRAERGMIGPSVTYTGAADRGLFFAATLDVDYHNENTSRTTTLNTWIAKTF
ncbi:hypothetical protein CG51_17340 [Haematobacter missouriensis]|uniref:Transporter n=1 Tax=Haematobacter missouriensis TaxID=366616 RepID=A0A212ANE1_9RHOB|nr:hypothetical protein [Haematobacter missouriensis]KFI24803.1 hypothetical protein CG51_17340 [Haematobacter missouriensis]OWJ76914.1 hypothetical protein CDV53_07135 [Haematobacter missouriensis]OWJ83011.1 hypothetical protein CDV52_13605 [Haematobacter missouriensis]